MSCPACRKETYRPVFKKQELKLLRCLNCNLVYVDGLSSKFEIKNYDYYRERLNYTESQLYNPITEKRYIKLLKDIEAFRKNNEIFEVGSGEGHFLNVAKKIGWHTFGVEKAPYAVEICRKFNIEVVCSDFLNLDLKSNYYDAVVMFEVLEHLIQPREYLLKINSILRSGGILILTTPNFDCIARYLLNQKWSLVNKEHLLYFTSRALKSALRNCNFRLLRFRVKHITLPELFKVFNNDERDIFEQNQGIRRVIDENIFLSFLKHALNGILSLTKLGESIECICQKP